MSPSERELLLEEELLMVRHSGEIPEIVYHSAIYYLSGHPEGGQLTLTPQELHALQDAALARSREIVLRDLDPDNRDQSIYRGIARSIANYGRMQAMCQRMERPCPDDFARETAQALLDFLRREMQDVRTGLRQSCINVTPPELTAFALELGVHPADLPTGWEFLCLDASPGAKEIHCPIITQR